MKTSIIALFATFLISCQSVIDPQIIRETSFKYNRCMLYCYDMRNLKILPMSRCDNRYGDDVQFVRAPLISCDETFGVKIDIFAERLKPQIQRAINECLDLRERLY